MILRLFRKCTERLPGILKHLVGNLRAPAGQRRAQRGCFFRKLLVDCHTPFIQLFPDELLRLRLRRRFGALQRLGIRLVHLRLDLPAALLSVFFNRI